MTTCLTSLSTGTEILIQGKWWAISIGKVLWFRPHPPRWKHRTENERINQAVKQNAARLDHAAKDISMLINPKWRNF